MSQAISISDVDREELLTEINLRMKGSDDNVRLLAAMEIENQSDYALRNWLSYLRRTRTGTK